MVLTTCLTQAKHNLPCYFVPQWLAWNNCYFFAYSFVGMEVQGKFGVIFLDDYSRSLLHCFGTDATLTKQYGQRLRLGLDVSSDPPEILEINTDYSPCFQETQKRHERKPTFWPRGKSDRARINGAGNSNNVSVRNNFWQQLYFSWLCTSTGVRKTITKPGEWFTGQQAHLVILQENILYDEWQVFPGLKPL